METPSPQRITITPVTATLAATVRPANMPPGVTVQRTGPGEIVIDAIQPQQPTEEN